ncbi:MAG: hypothetical protein EPN26_11715, partial [Rhodospirillales bacterium]
MARHGQRGQDGGKVLYRSLRRSLGLSAEDQPSAPEPLADHIRQTRDRFLALALAGAELLLEATPDGKIVFAVGTAMALVGKGARAIENATLFDLFVPAERTKLEQALARMRQGKRIPDIPLCVAMPDGTQRDISLSGYQIAGDFEGHLFLALKTRPPSAPPPLPPRQSAQAGSLPGKEDFAAIAKARLAEASHAGLDYDLTLLELPEVAALAAKAGPKAAEKFKNDLAQFLRDHSVGGDSAGLLDETKFGVVHAGDLNEGAIKSKIAELAGQAGQSMA